MRVGAEQSHGTVARPVAQCQVLVLGFLVREADLQYGRCPSTSGTGLPVSNTRCWEVRRRPGAIR